MQAILCRIGWTGGSLGLEFILLQVARVIIAAHVVVVTQGRILSYS